MPSIQKINGIASDTLTKVNGVDDKRLSNMLVSAAYSRNAPMFNSHSIDLNGSTQYINVDEVANNAKTESGTFAAWIKLDADGGSFNQVFRMNGTTSVGQNNIQIYWNHNTNGFNFQHKYGNNAISNNIVPGSTAGFDELDSPEGDDVWHHLVMIWTSDSMISCYDGICTEGVIQEGTHASEAWGAMTIGRNVTSDVYLWDGHINEVAMWDTALDTDEITTIYNARKGISLTQNIANYTSKSDLIAYWKFEEGTGTTVADKSVKGNDGDFLNAPSWSTDTI